MEKIFKKPLQDDSTGALNSYSRYAEAVGFWTARGFTVYDRGDHYEFAEKEVRKPTREELSKQARAERDHLLSETDYLVMPDYPSSKEQKDEVVKYRQALRDVPQQQGFPEKIEWPTAPAVLTKRA